MTSGVLVEGEGGKNLYQVIVDGKATVSLEDLASPVRCFKSIHFIPVIAGESSGGGMLAIIGVVLLLIAVSIITFGAGAAAGATGYAFGLASPTLAWVASTTLVMGLSLVAAGISSLIAPSPKTTPTSKPSFLFNGAQNTMTQGVPVPIAYGEVIVGSATISSGLTVTSIAVSNP